MNIIQDDIRLHRKDLEGMKLMYSMLSKFYPYRICFFLEECVSKIYSWSLLLFALLFTSLLRLKYFSHSCERKPLTLNLRIEKHVWKLQKVFFLFQASSFEFPPMLKSCVCPFTCKWKVLPGAIINIPRSLNK